MPKIAETARAARRDQIIAGAAECFARTGYHAATMADIAEAAGVSKGTPYLYFPGKEALFLALYEEWDCSLAARVDAAAGGLAEPARHSPRAVLGAVASAIAAHVVDNPQTCRVLIRTSDAERDQAGDRAPAVRGCGIRDRYGPRPLPAAVPAAGVPAGRDHLLDLDRPPPATAGCWRAVPAA
jgi:AcrR family transcriptional regulator